jgi:hypothetical protein
VNTNERPRQYKTTVTRLRNGLELTSLEAVQIGDWTIKASVSNKDSIIVLMSHVTDIVRVGMFDCEDMANEFVMYWVERI